MRAPSPARPAAIRRAPAALLALLLGVSCQPAKNDAPLTDFACDMELRVVQGEVRVGGPPLKLRAKFTNRGTQVWPGWRGDGSRRHNIYFGVRWFGPDAATGIQPEALFEDLRPGESVTADLEARPPTVPGNYKLRVEPLQPDIAWFGDTGSRCVVQFPVTVLP